MPKIAKVVGSVLPPPYGTVVAAVGSGIEGVNAAFTSSATVAQKSGNSFTLADVSNDHFECTYQYAL